MGASVDLAGLEDVLTGIRDDEPGVVLGVAVDGELVWSHGRGRTALAADAPLLSESTTFYVASLAKQVTAACVALLTEAGLVDVAAEARAYLPELPPTFDGMRVSDLVHHVSGTPSLEDEADRRGWDESWWEDLGTWEMVELIANAQAPPVPPGRSYRYANEGYLLLAAIIERTSGRSVNDWAMSQVFEPVGMVSSWYRDHAEAPAASATGHSLKEAGLEADRSDFHFVGDGGLVTTVADLSAWSGVHAQPFRLGRDTAARLTTRGRLRDGREVHYAWGLSVRPHHGHLVHSHGGQFVGNLAKVVQLPGTPAVTFIGLANRDDLDIDGLVRAAVDQAMLDSLDLDQPDWRETLRPDGLAWTSALPDGTA